MPQTGLKLPIEEIGTVNRGGNKFNRKRENFNKGRIWSFALLLAISLGRIGGGMFGSIHGPTLLVLANNVRTSVGNVGWLFAGRSMGVLLGGIATGFIMRKTSNMHSFGFVTMCLGAAVVATPWVNQLWLLVSVVMFGGVSYGYLDAGMQALILQIWGERDSRSLVSGYHFVYAVGSDIAPFIARPFLTVEDKLVCPSGTVQQDQSHANFTDVNKVFNNSEIQTEKQPQQRSVVWAYLICALFLLSVGLYFILLGFLKTEKRIRSAHKESAEKREEDRAKVVAPLFAFVCMYYFFCPAGEMAYGSYIYAVSICSELRFSITNGTLLSALYWAGFGSGRLAGVWVLKYIKPAHVIIANFSGTIISMVALCILGLTHPSVIWVVTFTYSFFQATVYPAGVSWTSQYTNMSKNYTFIFSVGNAFGSMIMLPVGGKLFDIYPFSIMYLVLGCSLMNAAAFASMTIVGRRILKRNQGCAAVTA